MALDVRMEKRRWIWELSRAGTCRFGDWMTVSLQPVKGSDLVTGWCHPQRREERTWDAQRDHGDLQGLILAVWSLHPLSFAVNAHLPRWTYLVPARDFLLGLYPLFF